MPYCQRYNPIKSFALSARAKRRRAFTLIELLVVVSIIALLIAILLPSLTKARRAAREVVCATNLHQLGVALSIYQNEYHRLPVHVNETIPDSTNSGRDPHRIRGNGFDARKQYEPYVPIETMLCPVIDNDGWHPGKTTARSIYVQYVLGAGYFSEVVDDGYRDFYDPWVSLSDSYRHNGRPLNVLAADVMRYVGPGGIGQGTNQVNHGFGLGSFYRFFPSGNWTLQSWNYEPEDVRWEYSMNTLFSDGSVNTSSADPYHIERVGMPAHVGRNPRWLVNLP